MTTRKTPPSLDSLLAQFDAAPDMGRRTLIAMALVRTRVHDDRILAALVRLLDENPYGAASCLARHGDARAVPHLARALDSDKLIAKARRSIRAAECLEHIAYAIERLGGTLTEAQRALLKRIGEAADRRSGRAPVAVRPRPHEGKCTSRAPRPERAEPCPCGSGKEYGECCAIERNTARWLH